jgi:hypothetical protein
MDAAPIWPIWRDEVPDVLLPLHVSLEHGNVLADGLPAEAQPPRSADRSVAVSIAAPAGLSGRAGVKPWPRPARVTRLPSLPVCCI